MSEAASAEVIALLAAKLRPWTPPAVASAWLGEAARRRLAMLELLLTGHPAGLLDEVPAVRWGAQLTPGPGYRIRKLLYEGYPGMWVPALLYEPLGAAGKRPAVLNPDGHDCAGNAGGGKQARCINLAKRGFVALSFEYVGMGELSTGSAHSRVSQLNVCGVYGVGVFYLVMKRALDVLLSLPSVDGARVAMTGCSGGGWQTILLSALDTRLAASIPVAGHSPVWQRIHFPPDIGDQEQVPPDLCAVADYDTLTALVAPRPCLLIYNHYDTCCFPSPRTFASVYLRAKPVYELLGHGDLLAFHDCLYPRTHNYDAGNRERMYRFLEGHFGLADTGPDLPTEAEWLSEGEAACGVPDDNATLLTLARQALVQARGHRRAARREPPEARRRRLVDLLRLPTLVATPAPATRRREQTVTLGPWQVALRYCPRGRAAGTLLLLDDRGLHAPAIAEATARAAELDCRLYAAGLWSAGQPRNLWQYHLLLEAAGERSLGVLVAQALGLGRLLARRHAGQPVHLQAATLTMPVVAVIAAALEPALWASLTTFGLMPSLDRLVDWPIDYGDCPALFCRDLVREFDIEELLSLSRPVPLHDPCRGRLRPLATSTTHRWECS